MEDFEVFQAALESDESSTSTFTRSISLVLDEFFKNLRSVGVSAVSGAGMDAFFQAIEASTEEYMENYKADLDKRRAEKQRLEEERGKKNMDWLREDMQESAGETVVLSIGLKDKKTRSKSIMDEDKGEGEGEEEDDNENYETITDDEDVINEDEDEEVA